MTDWIPRPVAKPAPRVKVAKGLRRRAPLEAKGGRLFPDREDQTYCAWLRTLPCPYCEASGRVQDSLTEVEHIVERSRGGRDRGDTTPTCAWHREQRHVIVGPKRFAVWTREVTGCTPRQLADQYERAYTKAFTPCP